MAAKTKTKIPLHRSARRYASLVPKIVIPTTQLSRLFSTRSKTLAILTGLLVLVLLAFPLRFLIMPALVNGQPIFSWSYVLKLHQKAGPQILDQMVNEMVIEQEIAKQKIVVTPDEINAEITQIEDQVGSASGGLNSLLALQGMTRDQFTQQVRLELSMEKLIRDTIQVSDADVKQELASNASTYTGLSLEQATATATDAVKDQKMREAFTSWFEALRQQAKVANFFTNPPLQLPKLF